MSSIGNVNVLIPVSHLAVGLVVPVPRFPFCFIQIGGKGGGYVCTWDQAGLASALNPMALLGGFSDNPSLSASVPHLSYGNNNGSSCWNAWGMEGSDNDDAFCTVKTLHRMMIINN